MYNPLGAIPTIPAADLIDLQSNANRQGVGNARRGSNPNVMGKRGGHFAYRDNGSGNLSLVFSTGDGSAAAWREADGSASYTPTNLGAFTAGADSSYADGLLTTDGGDDAAGRVAQSVALKAGKYVISGTAAYEGTTTKVAPRVRVGTSAGNGALLNRIVGSTQGHATAAEDAVVKEDFALEFTVASDATIHFTLDVVNLSTGAIAAGSAFITINPLQSK